MFLSLCLFASVFLTHSLSFSVYICIYLFLPPPLRLPHHAPCTLVLSSSIQILSGPFCIQDSEVGVLWTI